MVQADRMTMDKPQILCIVGPTACNKTETAVALAEHFRGEIVSADSVQVYIGMDIGSAKPTMEERKGIPHHMIDCVPIDTPDYSVSRYREQATGAIAGILSRGKLPILVGGSGLYVSALTGTLNFAVPGDAAIRAEMERLYDTDPEAALARLEAADPSTAKRLHRNDKKRIVRALEVYLCSGKPLSAYGDDFAGASAASPFDPVILGLDMDRALLNERINRRVDRMMTTGLYQEAENIYHKGYNRRLPAMQSIGYKQLFDTMDGNAAIADAVEQIKLDTRHFAKRQRTWFFRDKRTVWLDVAEYDTALPGIVAAAEERIRI